MGGFHENQTRIAIRTKYILEVSRFSSYNYCYYHMLLYTIYWYKFDDSIESVDFILDILGSDRKSLSHVAIPDSWKPHTTYKIHVNWFENKLFMIYQHTTILRTCNRCIIIVEKKNWSPNPFCHRRILLQSGIELIFHAASFGKIPYE